MDKKVDDVMQRDGKTKFKNRLNKRETIETIKKYIIEKEFKKAEEVLEINKDKLKRRKYKFWKEQIDIVRNGVKVNKLILDKVI